MRTPLPILALLLPACAAWSSGEPPPPRAVPPMVAPGATEPLRFGGLGLGSMRRGTEIGRYVWGIDCAAPFGRTFWTSGRHLREGTSWEERFAEVMGAAGYDVAGGGDRFYEIKEQRRRARYSVAAELRDVRLELCRREDWITGADLGISGAGSVKVDWALYDAEAARLLHRVTTTGSAAVDGGVPEGDVLLIEEAFAAAVEGLAADDGFRAAVAKGGGPPPSLVPAALQPAGPPAAAALGVDTPPPLGGTVEAARGRIAAALVAVGTGRGLVVGEAEGGAVLLAPAAAAGGGDTVTVRPAEGVALDGAVAGRDARTGLVLVRVPARLTALPLRSGGVAVSEPVHRLLDGRGRTAAGIVGGRHTDARWGGTVLLADLDGPPPRPGDPLLDDAGNLVGLALPEAPAMPGDDALPAFVPAGDALAALGATLRGRP
ncbi:serine protease [Azospirillum sp. ST 5-10]|uniref:serine protease n=1 Tax=unclassified Azospirillum TaxID=2630922 RepID=UPI003F4A3CAE